MVLVGADPAERKWSPGTPTSGVTNLNDPPVPDRARGRQAEPVQLRGQG